VFADTTLAFRAPRTPIGQIDVSAEVHGVSKFEKRRGNPLARAVLSEPPPRWALDYEVGEQRRSAMMGRYSIVLMLASTMFACAGAVETSDEELGEVTQAFTDPAGGLTWSSTPPFNEQPFGVVASSWSSTRLDQFYSAGPTRGGVLHAAFFSGTWHDWYGLGGDIAGLPAVVSWGSNRIDLFGVGRNTAVWHKAWNGSAWEEWHDIGGVCAEFGQPVAVSSWGANRLDIFCKGQDNTVWHTYWDNAWGEWHSIGGDLGVGSSPYISAVSTASNTIDIFALFADGQIYTQRWANNAWTGWNSIGAPPQGLLTTGGRAYISAAKSASNQAIIFVVNSQRKLYSRTQPYNLGWTIRDTATLDHGISAALKRGTAFDLYTDHFSAGSKTTRLTL
jgi:hypothetical protein